MQSSRLNSLSKSWCEKRRRRDMLPFPSFPGRFESCSNPNPCILQTSSRRPIDAGDSSLSLASKSEQKSAAACKSHSEAERRRRQRINAHLSTLRTLLPNKTKTDKASLLAQVVQHVRELRQRAAEHDEGGVGGFPGDTDEVTLNYCGGGEPRLIKATLCCEDRPGLNRELTCAIRSIQAKAVRAEMATLGGRTKSIILIQVGSGSEEDELGTLKRAFKKVVENRVSGSELAQVFAVNKRTCF